MMETVFLNPLTNLVLVSQPKHRAWTVKPITRTAGHLRLEAL